MLCWTRRARLKGLPRTKSVSTMRLVSNVWGCSQYVPPPMLWWEAGWLGMNQMLVNPPGYDAPTLEGARRERYPNWLHYNPTLGTLQFWGKRGALGPNAFFVKELLSGAVGVLTTIHVCFVVKLWGKKKKETFLLIRHWDTMDVCISSHFRQLTFVDGGLLSHLFCSSCGTNIRIAFRASLEAIEWHRWSSMSHSSRSLFFLFSLKLFYSQYPS